MIWTGPQTADIDLDTGASPIRRPELNQFDVAWLNAHLELAEAPRRYAVGPFIEIEPYETERMTG